MNSIGIRDYPYCPYCSSNNIDNPNNKYETIEHYLLKCPVFSFQRRKLKQNINKETNNIHNITVQLLLTGYPCKNWKNRRNIVQHTIQFIKDTNRMNI